MFGLIIATFRVLGAQTLLLGSRPLRATNLVGSETSAWLIVPIEIFTLSAIRKTDSRVVAF
jgi:hypothetical protein